MRNGDYDFELAPPGWPGKAYRGRYVYAHHLAYWKAHGVVPGPDELVHHKDENKRNNDPGNLELMTQAAHNSLHARERAVLKELTDPTPHGITRYSNSERCRCDVCREAWNKHSQEYRKARRAALKSGAA